MTEFEKWNQLAQLNPGDKVKTRSGKVYSFVRLKQKKFIGTDENDQAWDILVSSFEEVVEKVDQNAKKEQTKTEVATLKKGDKFYINKSGNALLFTFEEIAGGRIIGINPISNSRTRIDISLYSGKVADI